MRGLYEKISVQLCNLRQPDDYDAISAKKARHWHFKHRSVLHKYLQMIYRKELLPVIY